MSFIHQLKFSFLAYKDRKVLAARQVQLALPVLLVILALPVQLAPKV